jgi:hypothetical protein
VESSSLDYTRNFLALIALYSNLKRNSGRRKWRWYEELKEQRARDIETEML